MQDNDNLTYSRPLRRPTFGDSKQSERALLTTDRAQKLDLLIHLLTNLQQSLIVCGPEGIGKTTLIKTLQASHKEAWPICLLQGASTLSFESIATKLSQFLNPNSVHFDISSLQAFCARQKVVLIIDDAGELVPGLIGELIDFADSLPGLRLVFAMNYDEFQHKSGSDHAVESCHFIELPPLNQRQCLEYLQNLSAQPGAVLSFNAINDSLVEELYRKTQGIPGKLLAELPMMENYQSRQHRKQGLWIGAGLIIIISGYALKSLLLPETDELTSDKVSKVSQAVIEQTTPPAAELEALIPDINTDTEPEITSNQANRSQDAESPVVEPDIPQATSDGSVSEQNTGSNVAIEPTEPELNTPLSDVTRPPTDSEPRTSPTIAAEAESAKTPTLAKETKPSEPKALEQATPPSQQKPADKIISQTKTESDKGDIEWIMTQPATNYTVQLMVLSYKDSVNRFMKKHADYRDNLKYYTIGKSGHEKYVLIYGSFQSATDALKRKSTMPAEFNQGIVKRFKFIQRDSRRPK